MAPSSSPQFRFTLQGVAVATLLASLLLLSAVFSDGTASTPVPDRPRDYIVVLKDSVEDPKLVAKSQMTRVGGNAFSIYEHALKGYAATISGKGVVELRKDPRVLFVTPDRKIDLFEEGEIEYIEHGESELFAATIPRGINRIFAAGNKALDIDGSDDLRANVDVAVVDSGIEPEHPDLNVAGRVNCASGSCVANSGTDGLGHGTHVAGTIGALDNGVGVVGVAPGARLWAVKLSEGASNFTESAAVAGLNWVTAHASEIEVANASWGCTIICSWPAIEAAVPSVVEAGVVFVAAAGNSNLNAELVRPAKNPNAITVSAIADYDGKAGGLGAPTCQNLGLDDQKASFSNYGAVVDIAAPGVCTLSTFPGKGYGELSGTSMAAPHVTGAAAILAAQSNPNSKADVEAIRSKLTSAGNKAWTDTSGDGIQEPLLDVSNESTFILPRWIIHPTPGAAGATHTIVEDMACEPESTSACTAVGKQTSSGGIGTPYAMYWNGSGWVSQSTATPAETTDAEFQADHCLSKTSCVAGGYYTKASGTFSLVEAWNGTSWSIQATPNPVGSTNTRLKGISCKEITACIAVGTSGTGSSADPVAIRGNSGTWSLQSVSEPSGVGSIGAELTGVECISNTNCIAVGRYYTGATTYWGMIATWNGTTWSTQVAPKPTGEPKRSTLLDISCSSASNCTAVGGYMNKSGIQVSYVIKWNGTSWSHQASPNPSLSTNTPMQNVSCVASSPCVVVGDWLDSFGVWRPTTWYWNGASWVIEPAEFVSGQTFGVLAGVACRSSCLSVGWYTDSAGKNKTLGEIRKWPS